MTATNWKHNGSEAQRAEVRKYESATGLTYHYTEEWINSAAQEMHYHLFSTPPTVTRAP